MLYLLVFSIILNLHITCMQATCNKTLMAHQHHQAPLSDIGGERPASCADGQCLPPEEEAAALGELPHPGVNSEEVEVELSNREGEELDNLRLEYYKYKILSHLGITANPDLLAPKLQDNTRLLAKAMTSSLASSSSSSSSLISNRTIDYQQQQYGNQNKRHKRSLACSQVKSNKDACCLETFYVNFTEIGWDKWILYPSGYNANYCRGQCDLSHARYYHSTLLSKFSNIIGLCCSPKQMGPLRLLYIDEGNKVHQRSMPDMVVESCDCA